MTPTDLATKRPANAPARRQPKTIEGSVVGDARTGKFLSFVALVFVGFFFLGLLLSSL